MTEMVIAKVKFPTVATTSILGKETMFTKDIFGNLHKKYPQNLSFSFEDINTSITSVKITSPIIFIKILKLFSR